MVTGGTDNHLILLDLSGTKVTGKEAELALDQAGITVNKNTIPGDKLSPFITSGIRLGTPALTTRGMKAQEMEQIALWISKILKDINNKSLILKTREEVKELCSRFLLYQA